MVVPAVDATPIEQTTIIDGPISAQTCAKAIAVTLTVVVAGQLAGLSVVSAFGLWFQGFDRTSAQVATPWFTSLYQLTFGWIAVRWVLGGDVKLLLATVWPRLRIWHWVAIIVGLYALKAGASIVAVGLTMPAGAAAGGGSAVPAGLGAFAQLMRSSAWLWLLAGGVLAAIVEELIFRGYLSRILEASRLGWFGGAFIASLLWAGLHFYYPLSMQAVLVAVGLGLSFVRAWTGSVYPGMAWHVLNNIVGLIALKLLA